MRGFRPNSFGEQDAAAYLNGVITIPTSGLCVSTFRNDHAIGYQGVWLPNNEKAFLCKLSEGEEHNDHLLQFLAIAHAVVVAHKNPEVTIYSKSNTAISWASKAQVKSSFDPESSIMNRIERAIEQLKKIQSVGQVSIELWDSSNWGEIPKLM